MSTEDLEIEYRINFVLICNVNYYVICSYQRIPCQLCSMNYAYGFQDQGPDPNSPGTFKQNLQITLEYVATLREHARQALAGMYVRWFSLGEDSLMYSRQNAYHIGRNPSQTQGGCLS